MIICSLFKQAFHPRRRVEMSWQENARRRTRKAGKAVKPQVAPAVIAALVAVAVHLGALPVECLSGVLRPVAQAVR